MWVRENGNGARDGVAAGGDLTGRGGYDCGGVFDDPSFLEGSRVDVRPSEPSANPKKDFSTEDDGEPRRTTENELNVQCVSPIDLRGSPWLPIVLRVEICAVSTATTDQARRAG